MGGGEHTLEMALLRVGLGAVLFAPKRRFILASIRLRFCGVDVVMVREVGCGEA
jgi:hypothetical protein